MWKELLTDRVDVLRRQDGIWLQTCNIHPGIEDGLLRHIVAESKWNLPPELLDLYREMNGVELNWAISKSDDSIPGGILILSLQQAVFGYTERIEQERFDNAFEDSLWTTDSFSEESIRELKQHRVFEAVVGQPAFVTFKPTSGDIELFLVYEEDISSIKVSFVEYVRLMLEHLGATRIRDHLTQDNWRELIDSDVKLKAVRELR